MHLMEIQGHGMCVPIPNGKNKMIICFWFLVWLQPPLDDHLADIVDDEWRQDQLPHEQVYVPSEKLPDPEADNGDSHLTLLEQVSFRFLCVNVNAGSFITSFFSFPKLSFDPYRNSVGLIYHYQI